MAKQTGKIRKRVRTVVAAKALYYRKLQSLESAVWEFLAPGPFAKTPKLLLKLETVAVSAQKAHNTYLSIDEKRVRRHDS